MTFVQLIDCRTSKYDDMNRLMDSWVEATQGKRTATHSMIAKDRAKAGHYVEIVEFPSYEEAMRNSNLPETNRIFEQMVAICDETPSFTNLDVMRDEQLNKAACSRFFLEVCGRDDPQAWREMFAEDYHDHDGGNESENHSRDEFKAQTMGYRSAYPDFQFTVEDQIAEGDKVVTRWSWKGTNSGEFRGMPPTGKKVAITGCTTFTCTDGVITEGWWNWDSLSMMRQLGLVTMPAS